MDDKLLKIQLAYLKELYRHLPEDLEQSLPAIWENDVFTFKAFGEPCSIRPEGITLGGEPLTGPKGILVALYARNARREPVLLNPLKSFKEIKGSMPYQGAFTIRSEKSLAPFVSDIQRCKKRIIDAFDGHENEGAPGDFSFTVYPLPKIPLYYVFYRTDEEFPASVTCLFAANAELFLPVDGLADVAEYTAKKIIEIATS
ncbi:MAG: DUF3786 domain-containing protein [Deltaproteobacteria bacterium]|nr:MAG: DUF3786 domain-containing protein [Deltaproteobacteria bacterium]